MKKIIISIALIGVFCSLNAMEHTAGVSEEIFDDAFKESQVRSPITVVIQQGDNVSLTRERLQGLDQDLVAFKGICNIVMEVKPNNQGQYDITHLIKAEHQFVNEDTSRRAIAARKLAHEEGRSSAVKIPFIIHGCQKFKDRVYNFEKLIEIISKNEYSFSQDREICTFFLKHTRVEDENLYDLTSLLDSIWDSAFRNGQQSIQQIEAEKREKEDRTRIVSEKYKSDQAGSLKLSEKKYKNRRVTALQTGYSTKQLLASFGFGAGCIGFLWWIKTRN